MKFEVFLPDNSHKKFTEHDVKVVVASALYDKGICALGYAAESVGFDKRTLIEDMGKFDVPVLKMSTDDVKKVIENAKGRAGKHI
jgi:predicted HTH domain antitoxin